MYFVKSFSNKTKIIIDFKIIVFIIGMPYLQVLGKFKKSCIYIRNNYVIPLLPLMSNGSNDVSQS